MNDFEMLLCEHRNPVERFVKYRISSDFDADDILQEIYLAAYTHFDMLADKSNFKAWILGIARHKCNDYYRKKAQKAEISIDESENPAFSYGRMGLITSNPVRDILSTLSKKDQEILYLYYFNELPQSEIAKKLKIPIGTVKSRLHTAKINFKKQYPHRQKSKGDILMKQLPEYIPDYKFEKTDKEPFSVVWEELMGWFIVPKLGEKLAFGIYEQPEGKRTELCEMEVVGKAIIHGIEGVEINAVEHNPVEANRIGAIEETDRKFVAQLTDTHCRFLAESHIENGIRRLFTFLDTDSFIPNWGFGADNCGNEVHLKQKGVINMSGSNIICNEDDFLLDIVGRYDVEINGKKYDTVCVMDLWQYNDKVLSQQFLDKNGRTILWRRFNRDDWAFGADKRKWSEMLPESEILKVNGKTFVHWYDCITDYIL